MFSANQIYSVLADDHHLSPEDALVVVNKLKEGQVTTIDGLTMPFGKYQGVFVTEICEACPKYAKWLLNWCKENDTCEDIAYAIRKHLKIE